MAGICSTSALYFAWAPRSSASTRSRSVRAEERSSRPGSGRSPSWSRSSRTALSAVRCSSVIGSTEPPFPTVFGVSTPWTRSLTRRSRNDPCVGFLRGGTPRVVPLGDREGYPHPFLVVGLQSAFFLFDEVADEHVAAGVQVEGRVLGLADRELLDLPDQLDTLTILDHRAVLGRRQR